MNSVSFHVGDVLALPDHRYDAILCRGVLNDVVDTGDREAVFSSFAGALRGGGVLILDVREWEATKDRKQREPLFRKSVDTDRGKLTFTSITELDPERQQLLLSETHTLVNDAGEDSRDYRFVMRCWTRTELESAFERVGFGSVEYFGAYDPAVHPRERQIDWSPWLSCPTCHLSIRQLADAAVEVRSDDRSLTEQ